MGTILWVSLWVTIVLGLSTYLFEPSEQNAPPDNADRLAQGKLLYAQHCAACHGDTGVGNGLAARFLNPKPRDFSEAKFRLATTVNSMPTDDDLMRVIVRGMPGSAMFPFGHLSEDDRKSLVAYVRELTQSSFVAAAKREADKAGDKVDETELLNDAKEVLKPGNAIELPANWPMANDESIARGKASYLKTCASCHGTTGKGDGVQDQRNNDGTLTAPRDFTRGIFKGGREREQLFARIALGMPGTPMPATTDTPATELGDLVNFIQSLSSPEGQALVEHRRSTLSARRVAGPLPKEIPAATWSGVAASRITVSPLWWRNYAEPNLAVRALHDGTTLAVQLTWRDESNDERIRRVEDFEDMAGIQLFQGAQEPFVGMGVLDSSIDLWLWRASWQKPRDDSDSKLDDYPFDTPFYRERLKALGKPVPDFQTARAAGNPHARGDESSASALAAKGLGTTTFRPKMSQRVTAQSNWSNGIWTVELRRPLAVPAGEGVALAPGSRCSVGFAIWDGAARDRNGQKLVSIWHDLRIE
jgi:mono/diheme cytochrome c family protein